jgi:hypothetical protein
MRISIRQRKAGAGRAPGSVRIRVVGAGAATPRIVRRSAARPGGLLRRRTPR